MAEEHVYESQVAFADGQPQEGSPTTLFRQRPDRSFERKVFSARLRFPDGAEHEIWSFEDDRSGRRLPAPLIRVAEGDVVHATVRPAKGSHTMHWHGIEPDPRNDGAGHTSFEVNGSYTYQWIPQRGRAGDPNVGTAGTYFYHCHVNTPLHVQMGMFGPLVVDPAPDATNPTRAGARRAFVDGPEYDVQSETLLASYSVDPRWHTLNHSAGLSGEDVGLNRFEPRHFYVLGGSLAVAPRGDGVSSLTRITARVTDGRAGSPLATLVRVLNGGYHPTRLRFTDEAGRPSPIAEVISHDGRQFRDTSSTGPSRPLRDLGRPILTATLAFGAAEKFDVLLVPTTTGPHAVHVDWFHWVTGVRMGTRTVAIDVA